MEESVRIHRLIHHRMLARSRLDQLNSFRYEHHKPYKGVWLIEQACLTRFIHEQEAYREFLGMPPKKKQSNEWKGFINKRLTDAQKEQFRSWDFHDDEVWLFVSQATTEGYRFSTSYNKGNSTFNAVLSCNDADSPNNGYSLSAFAPTWYEAIRVLFFKHIVVYGYVWTSDDAVNADDNWG